MPSPDIALRLAQTGDQQAVWQACYPAEPWGAFQATFERSLQRQAVGQGQQLLAWYGPQVVGCAQLIRYARKAEIAEVVVAAPYRRQGIGTALITALEQAATALAWRPLEIGVTTDNFGALALYQRLGFVETQRLQLRSGQTAVILRKP